jgi:HD superfamily phosphohydrolase
VEAYVFARFHMYQTVYFHKTARAAQVMLQVLFERYRELLGQVDAAAALRLVPEAPPPAHAAFTGPMSLRRYLLLDDHTVTEFIKACTAAQDDVLQRLSTGLLNRRLYKVIDVSEVSSSRVEAFVAAAAAQLPCDLARPYGLVVDTPRDTPYRPYEPDAAATVPPIYVETPAGECLEISRISETVAQLRKHYELVRCYFPESVRERMERLAAEVLR